MFPHRGAQACPNRWSASQKTGRKAEFDGYLSRSIDPAAKATLIFRTRPFGFTSYYDTFKAVQDYNLKDVAGQIRCPYLITEPANEAYWPGQSRQLFDLVVFQREKPGALFPKVMELICTASPTERGCETFAYSIGSMRHYGKALLLGFKGEQYEN